MDTTEFPTVRLEVRLSGPAPGLDEFHLRENGVLLPDANLAVQALRQTNRPVGTVLVIDTSGSMASNGAIDHAKAAARQFVAGQAPNEWTAIVSFSSTPVVRSNFTQDAATLDSAIDSLGPVGETALWDGLIVAAHLYDQRPELQPNIVLLSDGADSISAGTEHQAVAALNAAHAAVFAVGIASAEYDPAGLRSLVGAAGGSVAASINPTDLGAQFSKIRAALENQYLISYRSKADGGSLELEVVSGETRLTAQTRAGTVGTAPAPAAVGRADGLFTSGAGKLLLLALAGSTAGLLAFTLLQIFGKRPDSLQSRLSPYAGGRAESDSATGAPAAAFIDSGLVRRAAGLTAKVVGRGDLLVRVGHVMEQANLPLRPAEALFFYGAGVVVLGLAAVVAAPSIAVGSVFAALVAVAPAVVVGQVRKRRLKAFEAQLPDTLNLLAGSLRAGYSFLQGLEAVVQETSDPMGRELRRVLAEARLGRPLEDALGDVAVRMESRDFDWSVLAIRIQREVGGNLAELLQTVAETMVQRSRLRGEVRALTAEGRISGVIMGLLPVGLALFMLTASPGYINDLFSSLAGWGMVIGSAVMAAVGFAWIQKIIKIEV
ncbi:MAG TPA: type II secretion system F family protein [Acidimicrobiia bacterium]|nr:type II secretion system F family protein [Acidimicrobiia bacterium]